MSVHKNAGLTVHSRGELVRRVLDELHDKLSLVIGEQGRVVDIQLVLENRGAGVGVGVVTHSAAWETPAARARSNR